MPTIDSQDYQLEFTVMNPNQAYSTGIVALLAPANGQVQAIGFKSNVLRVEEISLISDDLNLFWGIPWGTVSSEMNLGIFVDGGWNTLDIGWQVTKTTMIGSQFSIYI